MSAAPAVWFPTVRTGTGTDVFTERLAAGLSARGIRAEVTWLPLRAEYAPWTVAVPEVPAWANVVHVNTWLRSRFVPKGLPLVATLHHSMHDPTLRPYKGWLRAAYHRYWIAPNERRVLRRAQQVVAVSRFVAGMARRMLVDVPMQVIYNGVDTQKFQPGNRVRQPDEPFRLLYVGSWRSLKGVDLLSSIMRKLGGGFELNYTGGDAAKKDKPDMPPNMHDLGRLSSDDVIAAMQTADAFLFPSRSEGHPLAVVEAMACGLPVVATRGSSLVEVIRDGDTGCLCDQDDAAAFMAAIAALAVNIPKQLSMSIRACAEVAENYSLATMISTYIRAYQDLLDVPSRGCSRFVHASELD